MRLRPGSARPLRPEDLPAALALCAQDPVAAVLVATRLEEVGCGSPPHSGALGYWEGEELRTLLWAGANLMPVSASGAGLGRLARAVLDRRVRFSSLVGEELLVNALWSHLAPFSPQPRQVRRQPSLAITTAPRTPAEPAVRPGRPEEIELLLPASIAMFTEEYGYSPLVAGAGYTHRVRQLLAEGRSFLMMSPGPHPRVLFKAEIGAFAQGVAQIQGVWTAPDMRGRGLGASGTAAVVQHAFALGAHTVSLYVNDYNAIARRTYRRVGFREVGTFATVVL